jgi:hypothetical protein
LSAIEAACTAGAPHEEVDLAVEKEAKMASAVEERKAKAPAEVRTVLDNNLFNRSDEAERKRVSRVVATWLVDAHAAAHDDPATKRLARLVLGVQQFAKNMKWAGVFDEVYKPGLWQKLQALGAPLGEAFERRGLRAVLGGLELQPHALVKTDQARCAAAGVAHVLRSDIDGIVPLPKAWVANFKDPSKAVLRQRHERVFMHLLVLLAKVLNKEYHVLMRDLLGPHVVANEGVMAQDRDGSWRLTPPKGYARMEW